MTPSSGDGPGRRRIDERKRRSKVKGRPGIYYRKIGSRRRYEVTYLDSDGRRRWQTVPGFDNLDAADAALGESPSGTARERVTPARQTVDELQEEWSGQLRVSERTVDHYARDTGST